MNNAISSIVPPGIYPITTIEASASCAFVASALCLQRVRTPIVVVRTPVVVARAEALFSLGFHCNRPQLCKQSRTSSIDGTNHNNGGSNPPPLNTRKRSNRGLRSRTSRKLVILGRTRNYGELAALLCLSGIDLVF